MREKQSKVQVWSFFNRWMKKKGRASNIKKKRKRKISGKRFFQSEAKRREILNKMKRLAVGFRGGDEEKGGREHMKDGRDKQRGFFR